MKITAAIVSITTLLQVDGTTTMSIASESVMAPMPVLMGLSDGVSAAGGGGLVGANNDGSALLVGTGTNEYTPSSSVIPPVSKLDLDGDGVVTPAEWTAYTSELLSSATSVVDRVNDPHTKSLLNDIVTFHYANLHDCIQRNVEVRAG